ncbi:MAG: TetR/AcrR family transcriptional regulator [Hahellaceae bacterium]|nr:TetR/AcrR family transcriptional regulator [Hahellaceae bacterium]
MSDDSQTQSGPGRPKDPVKRESILDAAKCLFIQHGYEGCSMDAIASAASVSKLTVYSHFGDKEALFSAAVKSKCQEQLPELLFDLPDDMPIESALQTIGEAFFCLVNNPESINFHRVMVANASSHPKLANLFFEAGPQRVINEMERLLRRAVQAKKLDLPNPEIAADQFLCLTKGSVNFRLLMGCETMPPEDEIARLVKPVVDLFMRAYGPRAK